jgi:hypothetical protein
MLRDLRAYSLAFFDDLGNLLIGGMSLIPTVYGYFKDVPLLTSDAVKWGSLACGFILASYRIWKRSEDNRTADAVDVLVLEAMALKMDFRYMREYYGWPPPPMQNGSKFSPPFKARVFDRDVPDVYRYLNYFGDRIAAHQALVKEVFNCHRLDAAALGVTIDRDEFYLESAVEEFNEYVERLRLCSVRPKGLFRTLSGTRLS